MLKLQSQTAIDELVGAVDVAARLGAKKESGTSAVFSLSKTTAGDFGYGTIAIFRTTEKIFIAARIDYARSDVVESNPEASIFFGEIADEMRLGFLECSIYDEVGVMIFLLDAANCYYATPALSLHVREDQLDQLERGFEIGGELKVHFIFADLW